MKNKRLAFFITLCIIAVVFWRFRPISLVPVSCDYLRINPSDSKAFDIADINSTQKISNLLTSTTYYKSMRTLGKDGPPDHLWAIIELFADDEEVLEAWILLRNENNFGLYIPNSQLLAKDPATIGEYVKEIIESQTETN